MYLKEDGFFEGLKRAVEVVARHRDYPGKAELVGLSFEEIDGLNRRGRLSDSERDQLRRILLISPRHVSRGEGLPR